jgi:hypothetical protein
MQELFPFFARNACPQEGFLPDSGAKKNIEQKKIACSMAMEETSYGRNGFMGRSHRVRKAIFLTAKKQTH